jgi:hypothetical protein
MKGSSDISSTSKCFRSHLGLCLFLLLSLSALNAVLLSGHSVARRSLSDQFLGQPMPVLTVFAHSNLWLLFVSVVAIGISAFIAVKSRRVGWVSLVILIFGLFTHCLALCLFVLSYMLFFIPIY